MDLVAPSGDINFMGDVTTTDRMGVVGYETGNYTNTFGGTSAACPQVSGVAALMLSANPNLTETQVRNILQNTATDMGTAGFDNTFGFGRVNACAAITAALSLTISGNNSFCTTSNNYTVPNLPVGATVQWQATPTGVVAINSPNAPQTTLTKNLDGIITLTATISNICGGQLTLTKQNITVGTPSPYLGGTFNDGGLGINQPLGNTYNEVYNRTVYISLSGSSNEFTWDGFYSNGNVTWYHPAGYDGLVINFGNPPPVYYGDYIGFSIHRTNACGIASEPLYFYYVGPSQYYRIAPNPVRSTFTVTQIDLKRELPQLAKKEVNRYLMRLQIIDKMGNTVMEKAYPTNTKSATIDVSGLKSDIYTVRLFTDDKVELHKIVVQHWQFVF